MLEVLQTWYFRVLNQEEGTCDLLSDLQIPEYSSSSNSPFLLEKEEHMVEGITKIIWRKKRWRERNEQDSFVWKPMFQIIMGGIQPKFNIIKSIDLNGTSKYVLNTLLLILVGFKGTQHQVSHFRTLLFLNNQTWEKFSLEGLSSIRHLYLYSQSAKHYAVILLCKTPACLEYERNLK